jgi:RES domain-containing protein
MFVCRHCFGDSPALRARLKECGSIGDCDGCNTNRVRVVDAAELRDLFEGLRKVYQPVFNRYHYGKRGIQGFEPCAGDDALSQVMTENWEVFSDAIDEDTKESILGCVWPDYFGAYMSLGKSNKPDVNDHWDRLKQELMHKWRFFRDGGAGKDFVALWLEPFLGELESKTNIQKWWRARIQEPDAPTFKPDEMGAPPATRATAGRANPSGIPHLYVASTASTAVAEVRAEPGDWVSVAKVTIARSPLKVLDLTKDVTVIDPFAHPDLEAAIVARDLLRIFAYELSRPVRASDQPLEYVVTQFLSEYFRRCGFDGILYPSALNDKGMNAVFFNARIGKVSLCEKRVIVSKAVRMVTVDVFNKRQRRQMGQLF